VRQELKAAGPTTVYKTVSDDRVLGSITRSLIRRMPPALQTRLRSDGLAFAKPMPDPDWVEASILTNLSTQHEFASDVDADWNPPVDRTASLAAVLSWLDLD
jgi:hypothetical protein